MSNVTQRGATGKCSKPAGEYCRLHNPHPITAATTPEQVFAKAFPTHDKAALVKPPYRDTDWEESYKGVAETTSLLNKQAELAGIRLHEVVHVVNDDPQYDYIVNKEALRAAYIEQGQSIEYHDDKVESYNKRMGTYYKELISAEFSSPKDREIAQLAGLSRYAAEFVGYPDVSLDNYYDLGISRKEFFKRATEPEFARKLRNVEKAYIKAGRGGKEATETELNKLAHNRKKYAKSEDWDDVNNVATYDSNFKYSVYQMIKDGF